MKLFHPYTFPTFFSAFFSPAVFEYTQEKSRIFLTFDDGPTPEVTQYVLDLLAQYQMRASFFVIGDKIQQHKEILHRVKEGGHLIGNHTYRHLNAWKTPQRVYMADIEKTAELLQSSGLSDGKIFRPPYGKITPRTVKRLHAAGYRVVMWKHLSLDYNPKVNPARSLDILKKRIKPGDIIVFHDSEKAFSSLKIILPDLLAFMAARGWHSDRLP